MNWSLSIVFLLGLFSLGQAVILSLEESELGAADYRYFYLTVEDVDGSFYSKPFFTLVNNELSRPYGALGSLVCGVSTDGIAVYMDIDKDNLKEWTCQSINLLPFAHEGGGAPNPPPCSITAPSGIPAIWNASIASWTCGTYNQILTLATREDISIACGTADFLMMYDSVNEIRCVNPTDIDPSLTLQAARDVSSEEFDQFETRDIETRVDVKADKKWWNVMSDMDATQSTVANPKPWNLWRWTPYMNYDSTSGSSLIPSPPILLPFASQLMAVTIASFKLSSYIYIILPPSNTDTFTVVVSRLIGTSGLSEIQIANNIAFNSISATSGQLTYPFSGNAAAVGAVKDAFVAGLKDRSWGSLPISSDRHLVAITLWIQTTASFTEFFPLA